MEFRGLKVQKSAFLLFLAQKRKNAPKVQFCGFRVKKYDFGLCFTTVWRKTQNRNILSIYFSQKRNFANCGFQLGSFLSFSEKNKNYAFSTCRNSLHSCSQVGSHLAQNWLTEENVELEHIVCLWVPKSEFVAKSAVLPTLGATCAQPAFSSRIIDGFGVVRMHFLWFCTKIMEMRPLSAFSAFLQKWRTSGAFCDSFSHQGSRSHESVTISALKRCSRWLLAAKCKKVTLWTHFGVGITTPKTKIRKFHKMEFAKPML